MKRGRRSFLKATGGLGAGYASGLGALHGSEHIYDTNQQGPDPSPEMDAEPINRYPRMLHEYYTQILKDKERIHSERVFSLNTKAEALRYQKDIKNSIKSCLGPFPEKTPLNARIPSILERATYTVEKVMYESRPGFVVTANLYVPKHGPKRKPAVLGTCGHTDNGKAHPVYQSYALGLVTKGYIVLVIDPIGQGERLQYPLATGESEVGIGVLEHIQCGNLMKPTEESLSAWFAWDCIRGVDYLLSRPEVDPAHIGVTGNSGGGTQTTLLCGVDDRITMAAPSCFITSFYRNLSNQEVQDPEQCPSNVLAMGLDHFDFLAAMAPKPVIILSQEKDFFDVRGTIETYNKLKHFYGLWDAEDQIQLFIGDETHGYKKPAREAMYKFFNKVTGSSLGDSEPEIVEEPDSNLWCTESGQLSGNDSKPIHKILGPILQSLAQQRIPLSKADLIKVIHRRLQIQPGLETPDYRILRNRDVKGYPTPRVGDFLVETESGIHVSVYKLSETPLYSRPKASGEIATLYVSDTSAHQEILSSTYLNDLFQREIKHDFYACDLRGIGESRPNTRVSYKIPHGPEYYYATTSNMLGRSLLAQRTHDLLQVLSWLKSLGHREIHLIGNHWGSLPALFAALTSEMVTKTTLIQTVSSFTDLSSVEKHDWPLSIFVPGILIDFDLPECYAALREKDLTII